MHVYLFVDVAFPANVGFVGIHSPMIEATMIKREVLDRYFNEFECDDACFVAALVEIIVTLFVDTTCPIYLVSPSIMYLSWKALLLRVLKFLRLGNFLKIVILARLPSSCLIIKHYNNLKENTAQYFIVANQFRPHFLLIFTQRDGWEGKEGKDDH